MADKREIFQIILDRTEALSIENGRPLHQAFVEWFISLYFLNPKETYYSDGPRDGKIDALLKIDNDREITYQVINSKFTKEYNKIAPPSFYDEIVQFHNIFRNKGIRAPYLEKAVKGEVAQRAEKAFKAFDDDRAKLYFITNHRINKDHCETVKNLGVEVFHLEDLIHFLIDDLDGAMPKTDDLILTDVQSVLSPGISETEVSTSIVFGKLKDFIDYMNTDSHDLLFARNIRLDLRNTLVNKDIRETFRTAPNEFAFSNNGITMLCDRYSHDLGSKSVCLENPRVVNGSQTLHSIREVAKPSPTARVMIRIIQVPPNTNLDLPSEIKKKKDIVHKISTRTNQQNPIKRWNLVANDDFQLEIFRLFRSKKLFYERREKEWSTRSRDHRSRGFKKGPSIKRLMQLITSARWGKDRMGPFVARTAGDVFESATYDSLIQTEPEEAFRIYLLSEISNYIYNRILRRKQTPQYFKELDGYVNLALFATLSRLIELSGPKFKRSELSRVLEVNQADEDKNLKLWDDLVFASIKHIHNQYLRAAKKHRAEQKNPLTIPNYFKNSGNSKALLASMPPPGTLNTMKKILRAK
jgi:hypothetical protein